jgi:UDP-3-O-[3-hydroxymyristoyl] N-acetylglucosamine deacetylase
LQNTLSQSVTFAGHGLHHGRPAKVVLWPAPAGHGIVFRRSDLVAVDALVPARWDLVVQEPLNTRIENESGVSVATVEHLMAALAGCGIHNVLIEIDGPEVPILDGSSAQFVRGLIAAGIQRQNAPLRAIKVLKPVEVSHGAAKASLLPSPNLQIDFSIEFADAAIGRQSKMLSMANGTFVRELSSSRTFCRQADVDAMHAAGLALGGSYDNAVVVEGDTVLTPGGLRYSDEAVRHKMLDALGDLYTAGAPILGRYVGTRAGHALTNKLLRALFADPEAWAYVDCDTATAESLPGAGLHASDLAVVA